MRNHHRGHRRIADNVADLRAGTWNEAEYGKAKGLYGRTLGLIGLGGIGREMIPRAKEFGMPIVAWSRSLTADMAAELASVWQPPRRMSRRSPTSSASRLPSMPTLVGCRAPPSSRP